MKKFFIQVKEKQTKKPVSRSPEYSSLKADSKLIETKQKYGGKFKVSKVEYKNI